MIARRRLPKRAVRQYPRNFENKKPVACPAIAIDLGSCAKRPVVPLSILCTHWINELWLRAVKACSLAIRRRLHSTRRQTAMQSHGYSELVAELPQWRKKQEAGSLQCWRRDRPERPPGQLHSQRSQYPEIDSPKFVADEPPSRQKGGDTIGAWKNPRRCSSSGFPLLEHARKKKT